MQHFVDDGEVLYAGPVPIQCYAILLAPLLRGVHGLDQKREELCSAIEFEVVELEAAPLDGE